MIRSLQWDYEVSFADTIKDVLEKLGDVPEACVVIDAEVERLHGAALRPLLDRHAALVVEPSEEAKSLRGVERLIDWLIEQRVVRSGTVIAVGGGCIQDLVSFTSHIYYRGINWIFLPTTVLSQADSCIGAKSGINVLPFKNQLGALHSPRRILVAEEFLKTLPRIEVASGYGEIVKLSVTSSRHFLPFLESSLAEGGLRNGHLLELERAALAAKQEIIEEDEYEADLRRVLNYGHSFGHALETLSGHAVPHGLAVLWGIDVINALGVRWGHTPLELASRLHALIEKHFDYVLPVEPSARDLVEAVSRDKKVARGLMNFVVLRAEGSLFILPRPLDEQLIGEVEEVLQGNSELGAMVFARR